MRPNRSPWAIFALALGAASAAFFVAVGPFPAQASTVGQTFTVPQCVSAATAQDLMADVASPDDCLFGTTGGPFTPNPGNAGFLLLKQGGHIILQQGGSLECHC